MEVPLLVDDFLRRAAKTAIVPTSIDFVEALPRTVTGKLQKFLIREQ